MNKRVRIKPLPLLYTVTSRKDRINHVKVRRKLDSFETIRRYIPFRYIHRLWLYQNFKGTKLMKNINILKTFAGVKSLRWITRVKSDGDFCFAYRLIKKYKKITKLSFNIQFSDQNMASTTSFWIRKMIRVVMSRIITLSLRIV